MDDRVLITVSEAARRLDTYPNAINRWISKGELEAFRVEGRGFRFMDAERVEALKLALVGMAEKTSSPLAVLTAMRLGEERPRIRGGPSA